jgi:hypothetical protein
MPRLNEYVVDLHFQVKCSGLTPEDAVKSAQDFVRSGNVNLKELRVRTGFLNDK